MDQILQFNEIKDYVSAMNLNVESRYPDFLIYDYEKQHPDSCAELQPFRQNYFEVNLGISEGCNSLVDQFELPEVENRLTLISPHRLQTLRDVPKRGTPHKGYGLFFKPEFISTSSGNIRFVRDFPFFSHLNSPFLSLEKKERHVYEDILRKILAEYETNSSYSREIIKNYLNILFLKAKESYPERDRSPGSPNREQEIYDQFIQLVQTHFLKLKSVRSYAEKIHITPKHLSETVKKVTGSSALDMIHQAQIQHAKALLRQTPKTVTEIAYDLNFENPEYFSVFFKRVSGKSPSQFRIS